MDIIKNGNDININVGANESLKTNSNIGANDKSLVTSEWVTNNFIKKGKEYGYGTRGDKFESGSCFWYKADDDNLLIIQIADLVLKEGVNSFNGANDIIFSGLPTGYGITSPFVIVPYRYDCGHLRANFKSNGTICVHYSSVDGLRNYGRDTLLYGSVIAIKNN